MENLNDLSHSSKDWTVKINSGYGYASVNWIPGFRWVTECTVNVRLFPFDTQVSMCFIICLINVLICLCLILGGYSVLLKTKWYGDKMKIMWRYHRKHHKKHLCKLLANKTIWIKFKIHQLCTTHTIYNLSIKHKLKQLFQSMSCQQGSP